MENNSKNNKTLLKALIKCAEDAIGFDESNDYEIMPSEFHSQVKNKAPQLSALLHSDALTETARRYERNNKNAIDVQQKFKNLSNQATWAIFVATISAVSITFFTPSPNITTTDIQIIPLLLGSISLIGGAWAAWGLHHINSTHLLEKWMQARAKSETDRIGYFNRLIGLASKEHSNDAKLLLLVLEFFRRYQLTIQQNYYEGRGQKHRQSLQITTSIGSMAASTLALGSGGTAIIGAFQSSFLQFSIIGIFGTALALVASRREELNQDERNSERYCRTAELLSHIREYHDKVQLNIAAGNTDILMKYVSSAHEQLSLEHRQWLSETESMNETIRTLTTSLNENHSN